MRIGYFGGSFDPPHLGHLAVARAARDRFALDRVLLAPTARQPLKPSGPIASFADRLHMTELLCAGQPGLEASAIDGPQPDNQPNYTVDTLRRLTAQLTPTPFGDHSRTESASPTPFGDHSRRDSASPTPNLPGDPFGCHSRRESALPTPEPPGDPFGCHSRRESALPTPEPTPRLFAILGADAFLTFPRWRDPAELLHLAEWIIVSRPGFPLPSLSNLPLTPIQQTRIHQLTDLAHPISASILRHRLATGDPCPDDLPKSLYDYLLAHRLYGA